MPKNIFVNRLNIFVFLLVCFLTSAKASESIDAEHVRIRLLAPEQFSNEATTVGIYFEPDPDWHVYWKNSGDSGAAPKFQFTAKGADVGPIQWPYPKRLPIAHLVNLGYEGAVAYLFNVTAKAKTVQMDVKLEWLVCKEECIPGFGNLTFERPGLSPSTVWNAEQQTLLEHFQKKIPFNENLSPWKLKLFDSPTSPSQLIALVTSNEKPNLAPELFPTNGEFLSPAAPSITPLDNGFRYVFQATEGATAPQKTGFVLVDKQQAWEFQSVSISAQSEDTQPIAATEFLVLLLSAFIGGILLNLMPCVFPVLSIKILSLVKNQKNDGQNEWSYRLREGLLYTAGVLVTFCALGALFLGLRAAGSAVGWGFQLQSPVVVLSLAILFWLMALNFLGTFDFGVGVMNIAGKANSWSSSFGTGMLSVFVAAPCTGPFMGSALGAAATLAPMLSLSIFFGLGLGLAFPFLILAASPKLSSFLPRPGKWMDTLKQFLAFPLFLTVIWLVWVLGRQLGHFGWIVASLVFVGTGFCVWLAKINAGWVKKTAVALGVIFIAAALINTRHAPIEQANATSVKSDWNAYDSAAIDAARADGRPVFIDFTASWCVICQVNKKVALDTERAAAKFEEHNVYLVRADWTTYDATITQVLATFGRSSVPLYIFYPAKAPISATPQILPQLLTVSMIEDLFPDNTKETQP